MVKSLITKRRLVQFLLAFIVYEAVFVFNFNLFYLVAISVVLGGLMGKTFCRWMCPIGFFMETFTALFNKDNSKLGMYNYHKVGCPIAWIQGYLNRASFLKIKLDPDSCTHCGVCDSTCYISTYDKSFSLHKKSKENPGLSFRCSKCLECVTSCPTGSLSLKTDRQAKS